MNIKLVDSKAFGITVFPWRYTLFILWLHTPLLSERLSSACLGIWRPRFLARLGLIVFIYKMEWVVRTR